jgi:periplasmic mercuric ion binding protein
MKTIKNILIIAILSFFAGKAVAHPDSTIVIKTSARCESCKKRIENALNFEKGVKSSILDVNTKEATVMFDPEKTSSEKIRTVIAKAGYDADIKSADTKAYKKLPKCCQKGEGHESQ